MHSFSEPKPDTFRLRLLATSTQLCWHSIKVYVCTQSIIHPHITRVVTAIFPWVAVPSPHITCSLSPPSPKLPFPPLSTITVSLFLLPCSPLSLSFPSSSFSSLHSSLPISPPLPYYPLPSLHFSSLLSSILFLIHPLTPPLIPTLSLAALLHPCLSPSSSPCPSPLFLSPPFNYSILLSFHHSLSSPLIPIF